MRYILSNSSTQSRAVEMTGKFPGAPKDRDKSWDTLTVFHLNCPVLQSVARGQTAAPPAGSATEKLTGAAQRSKLQHKILEETEPFQTSEALQPVSHQLDTRLYSRGAVSQAGVQDAENQREDREEAGGRERLLLLKTAGVQTGV